MTSSSGLPSSMHSSTVVDATGNRVTFRVPFGVPTGSTVVTAANPGGHVGSIAFTLSGIITARLDPQHRVERTIGPQGGTLALSSGGVGFPN